MLRAHTPANSIAQDVLFERTICKINEQTRITEYNYCCFSNRFHDNDLSEPISLIGNVLSSRTKASASLGKIT